jgi:hypothetical protein
MKGAAFNGSFFTGRNTGARGITAVARGGQYSSMLGDPVVPSDA